MKWNLSLKTEKNTETSETNTNKAPIAVPTSSSQAKRERYDSVQ